MKFANLVTTARGVRRENKCRFCQISVDGLAISGSYYQFKTSASSPECSRSRKHGATTLRYVILNILLDTITFDSVKSQRQDSDRKSIHRTCFLTSDSSLQSISTAMITILDRAGSKGNSTIWRPRGVRLPVLSSAPKIHSWYMEFKMLSYKWT